MKRTLLSALLLASAAAPTASVAAQDPALVEALAPLLMAEDRRVIDPAIFPLALEHPDPLVRRTAVTAIGRIRDPHGLPLLLPRLTDRDPTVVTAAIFALGQLGDRAAVEPLVARLQQTDTLSPAALGEAAIALARLGGPEATRVLRDVIGDLGELAPQRRDAMRNEATINYWRLGSTAPTDGLIRVARDTSAGLRWRAIYALGRLQVPAAGDLILTALRDRTPVIREAAARSLTARYVGRTILDTAAVVAELDRAIDDLDAGVRVNALQAMATFGDRGISDAARTRLRDEDRNVRVSAATTLGALGDTAAIRDLVQAVAPDANEWGVRQAALGALARLSPAAFTPWGEQWLRSGDVFDRLAAIAAWRQVGSAVASRFVAALEDRDPRVQAAALDAWVAVDTTDRAAQRAAAERAWRSEDPLLRATALAVLADQPTDAALDLLATAWQAADGAIRERVLGILGRWARRDPGVIDRLAAPSRRALLERPDDPTLRAIAARTLPTLAAVWGPVAPIETGLALEDYRRMAGRFLLAKDNPRVTIDVTDRGTIEIELLPREAPLTVANFLRLVDRHYFDNIRWHRVVPNFVVQAGDPTGTGEGGPGWAIRDEINRLHYDVPMLGMALSGPDTGGSQWFINLSPQPHLDGGYTIFGKVSGGYAGLSKVLQGDVIRSISRTGPS